MGKITGPFIPNWMAERFPDTLQGRGKNEHSRCVYTANLDERRTHPRRSVSEGSLPDFFRNLAASHSPEKT